MRIMRILIAFLILTTSLLTGCRNQHTTEERLTVYRDFDVFTKKGLGKFAYINGAKSNSDSNTFYRLIDKDGELDSIIITNPIGKGSPTMGLKLIKSDSVTIYKTDYPYEGGKKGYKTYYVFSPKKAVRYMHWDDGEWLVIFIMSNASFGGAKVIDDIDTLNFEKRLLRMDSIKMRKMPFHKVEEYPTRLDKQFTFNRWLHDSEGSVTK
jgi:hypothetical protein